MRKLPFSVLSDDLRKSGRGQAGKAANFLLKKLEVKQLPISPQEVAKKVNIPVFFWDFPKEVSGLCKFFGEKVVIAVNQNHAQVRQRFTVAHELGHWIFHQDSNIQDYLLLDVIFDGFQEDLIEDTERALERQANQFAADLLMPRELVKTKFNDFGIEGLPYLAKLFNVSEQAFWFRLVTLKLVNNP